MHTLIKQPSLAIYKQIILRIKQVYRLVLNRIKFTEGFESLKLNIG